jgi:flagellar motor switch protein FliG
MGEDNQTGLQAVIEMFRVMDEASAKSLLERLALENPALVEKIKANLVTFADLCRLEDASLQLLIRETPPRTLMLALRGVPEPLRERVMANMGQRARQSFTEEQNALGPVRLSDAEAARQSFIALAKKLESEGKLTIRRI